MFHLVFNETSVPVLQSAMELDETLQAEIILIEDDYSLGAIENIYTGEGKEARKEWWQNFSKTAVADKDIETLNDSQTIAQLVGRLRREPEETVWIWAAQNSRDVCGYYWVLNYLKEFQGRIFILYLNNLPFINEKGSIFYPDQLGDILPSEFLKAKKLAREITPSEFEVDPDEWTKLVNESSAIRLLEGGKKVKSAEQEYFDADLKKYITADWQKAAKVLQQFHLKNQQKISEAFLLYRLKSLAATEGYDVQGKVESRKDFEIKKAV